MTTDYYTTSDVVRITGASYRQIDHWTTEGYLLPKAAGGSGFYRHWPSEEVRCAAVVMALKKLRGRSGSITDLEEILGVVREDEGRHPWLVVGEDGLTFTANKSDLVKTIESLGSAIVIPMPELDSVLREGT